MKSNPYYSLGTEVRTVPNPYLPTRQEVGRYGTGHIYMAVPSVPTCPSSCSETKSKQKTPANRTSLHLHAPSVPVRTIRTYSTIGGTKLWQI